MLLYIYKDLTFKTQDLRFNDSRDYYDHYHVRNIFGLLVHTNRYLVIRPLGLLQAPTH